MAMSKLESSVQLYDDFLDGEDRIVDSKDSAMEGVIYPWMSSLAYGYFHHLFIAMLNISTVTYQLHSSSQQDSSDHFTHLFDISYGACIQRKGERELW